jgi:hypothetical protein
LSNKAILITGLGHQGKTYLAHELSKLFKCMVYTQHKDDIKKYWGKEKVLIAVAKDYVKEFPFWCLIARMAAENGKINCFIVDDADGIFKNHFDTCKELSDLVVNHFHYNLAMIFISRRPQDIPTKVYNAFEVLCLFSIDAPQAIQLLNKYSDGLGDAVKELPYDSHEFFFKHVGREPVRLIM